MLGQRSEVWTSIVPVVDQRLILAGQAVQYIVYLLYYYYYIILFPDNFTWFEYIDLLAWSWCL